MFNTKCIQYNKTVTKHCSFEFQGLINGAPKKKGKNEYLDLL
jgi:hypothetical protein